jgi:hypothetical protein
VELSRRPLHEFAQLAIGWPLSRALDNEDGGEYPIIQPRDLDGVRLASASTFARARLPRLADRYRVEAGDLVLLNRGAAGPTKVCFVDSSAAGAVITSNLTLIRARRDVLLGEALLAYLLSESGQAELRRRSATSTVRALTIDQLGTVQVPVPDPATQERIVALWHVTELSYIEAVAAAEDRRALGLAVLDRLFHEGTVPRFPQGGRR